MVPFEPADPNFAFMEKGGTRIHCASGTQTLMSLVGRAGVKG